MVPFSSVTPSAVVVRRVCGSARPAQHITVTMRNMWELAAKVSEQWAWQWPVGDRFASDVECMYIACAYIQPTDLEMRGIGCVEHCMGLPGDV